MKFLSLNIDNNTRSQANRNPNDNSPLNPRTRFLVKGSILKGIKWYNSLRDETKNENNRIFLKYF